MNIYTSQVPPWVNYTPLQRKLNGAKIPENTLFYLFLELQYQSQDTRKY